MSDVDHGAIRALRQKAVEAMAAAQRLVGHDQPEAATNRAYHAAFPVARAALLAEKEEPGTHSGVLSRFSNHFVRTHRIFPETAKSLARAHPPGRGLIMTRSRS